jgi:hypothetical protein
LHLHRFRQSLGFRLDWKYRHPRWRPLIIYRRLAWIGGAIGWHTISCAMAALV